MLRPRPPFLQPGSSFRCSGGPLGQCFSLAPGCHPERSEGSAFFLFDFELSTINLRAVTPFPATLANLPQVNENKTTLSLSFATLTSRVTRKFFACHSYENTGDVPPKTKTCFRVCPFSSLATRHSTLSPVESALTKNTPITRLESALTKKPRGKLFTGNPVTTGSDRVRKCACPGRAKRSRLGLVEQGARVRPLFHQSPVMSHQSRPAVPERTSNSQPATYGIIPPHRGNTHNPLRIWGGFSD